MASHEFDFNQLDTFKSELLDIDSHVVNVALDSEISELSLYSVANFVGIIHGPGGTNIALA